MRFGSRLYLFVAAFAVVGAVALFISLAAPASKGGKTYLTSLAPSFQDLQYPVEQESPNFFNCGGSIGPIHCPFDQSTWVNNPTDCVWDVDDGIQHQSIGTFKGGSTVTDTACLVDDGLVGFGHRHAEVNVAASSPGLKITLSNDKGFSQTAIPVQQTKNSYLYLLCIYDDTAGPYPTIADSNNGYGVEVNYTLTAVNPSNHDYGSTAMLFSVGIDRKISSGCTSWQPS